MALDLRLSEDAANAQADATSFMLDDGYLRIYDGTRPASSDDPVTTQNLLAELRFGNPAFASASGGTITANAIISDPSAAATGLASWYRVLSSDGTTAVFDGTVDTSDANLVMNNTNIQINAQIDVSSFTYTVPQS